MAGAINTLYVAVIVLTVMIGLGLVLQRVSEARDGGPRWLEWSSVAIALLFVVILGGEVLV